MGDRKDKAALFEEFARVGKALANGKRLELIDLLAQGERSVESLATAAELGLTTASAHLQTLRQAGLVTTRREGTRIFYALAGPDVLHLFALLRSVGQARIPAVEQKRLAYFAVDGRRADDRVLGRDDLVASPADRRPTLVDVRPLPEYAAGHIPGAVSVPLDELDGRVGELPRDAEVVAYCRGGYCVMAHEALGILRAHGVEARRLEDGMLEWRLAGLPVEPGDAA
ncbi:MAG TPA: metalloregulator ArsR/SmtB family transcription factor [Propionibacteriaceae bacterium]|nr:metalloregulator ArsR/SmtB family transcription factor [Propionibacteriaceae bacterium]